MQYLTIWDLILTPVYLIVLINIGKRWRDKRYPPGHPLRKYYLPGLYVKFAGAVFIGLIYQYYYGGGDTYNFFSHAQIINSSLKESIGTWLELVLQTSPDKNPHLYQYTSEMQWYGSTSDYSVAVFAAILGLLNGTSYMPIALLFAFVSFSGIWAMFKTFAQIYPRLQNQLVIPFLFIPSIAVWGSAIFKDTICMFGLGWMVHCTFRVFIDRDLSFKNLLLLGISFYLIAIIKLYILLAFVPAVSLWLLMTYSHKIKNVGLRWIMNLFFVALVVAGFLYFTSKFANELNQYSLDKIAQTAEKTRGWISYSSGDEGSAYDLGNFSPTITGMLSKFPSAVIVTLFRPFVWESKKVIMFLSAIEALIFLYFTLKVLNRQRWKIFSVLSKDPNLAFCLIFSIIFAFAVGISSYNFGALSRYKIPCLPFYGAFLVICFNYTKAIRPKNDGYTKRLRNRPSYA